MFFYKHLATSKQVVDFNETEALILGTGKQRARTSTKKACLSNEIVISVRDLSLSTTKRQNKTKATKNGLASQSTAKLSVSETLQARHL